jgi:hypothetical protein
MVFTVYPQVTCDSFGCVLQEYSLMLQICFLVSVHVVHICDTCWFTILWSVQHIFNVFLLQRVDIWCIHRNGYYICSIDMLRHFCLNFYERWRLMLQIILHKHETYCMREFVVGMIGVPRFAAYGGSDSGGSGCFWPNFSRLTPSVV